MSDPKNIDDNPESVIESLPLADSIIKEKIKESKKENDASLVSMLFELFASLYFDKNESSKYWDSIIEHRAIISERLKRDVGIRVAILDYFSNIETRFKNPKIVEMELFEKILKASKEDAKTGLYNSKYFFEILKNEINKAKRNDFPLSILFLDIDNFKEYNDKHGHAAGDQLLLHIAEVIKQLIRGEDVAARFGGDEFVIMLTYNKKDDAYVVANRILKEVKKQPLSFDKGLKYYNGSLSIGISSYPVDTETPDELMKKADIALYNAKKDSKNKIFCYKDETKKEKISKNRRRIVRYDINGNEVYFYLKNSKDKYRAYIKNISEEGLLIKIPYIIPLLQGTLLEIEVKNKKKVAFHLAGEILYAKRHNSGYLAAIKFDDSMKDSAMIKKYIDIQKEKS